MMPIRKDLKHLYSREWKNIIRPRILARASYQCEQCGKPDHTFLEVVTYSGRQLWNTFAAGSPVKENWIDCLTGKSVEAFPTAALKDVRIIRVVLTVAHLNHNPTDNREDNLKALCQWCHLNQDKEHHRETRKERKDQARPILAAIHPCGQEEEKCPKK